MGYKLVREQAQAISLNIYPYIIQSQNPYSVEHGMGRTACGYKYHGELAFLLFTVCRDTHHELTHGSLRYPYGLQHQHEPWASAWPLVAVQTHQHGPLL